LVVVGVIGRIRANGLTNTLYIQFYMNTAIASRVISMPTTSQIPVSRLYDCHPNPSIGSLAIRPSQEAVTTFNHGKPSSAAARTSIARAHRLMRQPLMRGVDLVVRFKPGFEMSRRPYL